MHAADGSSASAGERWVVVAGGVSHRGGMDAANAALVDRLLGEGATVHLVAFAVDEEYRDHPAVRVHLVRPPLGSHFLGEFALGWRARSVMRELRRSGAQVRAVANGGNWESPDVNWAHCVHAAWHPVDRGAPLLFRLKNRLTKWRARRQERRAFRRARLVIANSERTRRDVIALGVDPSRVKTVYLGGKASWSFATLEEREAALQWLQLDPERPVVAFVGALGHDRNKGIDVLWEAWLALQGRDGGWDAQLVVAGEGGGVATLRAAVEAAGLAAAVRILGWTDRVRDVLAAADVLVSPVHYEAYGLNVHEAVLRGVPAIVSAHAGVAERLGAELQPLLLRSATPNAAELRATLLRWRADVPGWREAARRQAAALRDYDESRMATRVVELARSAS